MSEPFVAEIRIFAGNFAPRGWAFCDGQLLPISQNTALFALIGTIYGGDGQSTTALPNMQGRAPVHPGQGPGLTPKQLGQKGGVEMVTLSEAQMPNHTHTMRAAPDPADLRVPNNLRAFARAQDLYLDTSVTPNAPLVDMATQALPSAGGSQSHNNLQPYIVLNYIIALEGLFPSQS
ncbi:MAG: tail fiber protein [Phycisphaerales bacterium]|nr:tail fiber protein [Phycisphaerales bacterium]